MVEIRDEDDLKKWLKDKPRDVAVMIGARAALRAVPFLKSAYDKKYKDVDHPTLMSFRALAISWSTIAGFDRHLASDAAMRARFDSAFAADKLPLVDVEHHSLIQENFDVNHVTNAASLAVKAVAAGDPLTSARATSIALLASTDKMGFWYAVEKDVEACPEDMLVKDGAERDALFQRWHETPLWVAPGHDDGDWQAFREILLTDDRNWQPWIDWYEDRLKGAPQNRVFENALLSITENEWKLPVAGINALLVERMVESEENQIAVGDYPDEFKELENSLEEIRSSASKLTGAMTAAIELEDRETEIPASDRIVTNRDNYPPESDEEILERVIAEYQFDRSKIQQDRARVRKLSELIDDILGQIKSGFVNLPDLRDRLAPELKKWADAADDVFKIFRCRFRD